MLIYDNIKSVSQHSDMLKEGWQIRVTPTSRKGHVEIVSGLTLRREVVLLDDKHFIDCTFTKCQLIYGGGGVIFERTNLLQCRHILRGPARATVLYLQKVGLIEDKRSSWTEFSENVN